MQIRSKKIRVDDLRVRRVRRNRKKPVAMAHPEHTYSSPRLQYHGNSWQQLAGGKGIQVNCIRVIFFASFFRFHPTGYIPVSGIRPTFRTVDPLRMLSWAFLLNHINQKNGGGIPFFSGIDHKNDFYRPLVGALNEFWKGILGDFMLIASTFNHYTPENQHGTWKSPVWKGRSSSKPPFLGSILLFGGVRDNTQKNLLDEWSQGWVDFLNWIRRFCWAHGWNFFQKGLRIWTPCPGVVFQWQNNEHNVPGNSVSLCPFWDGENV